MRTRFLLIFGFLAATAVALGAEDGPKTRPANRLAKETSPYLLQHAHNPVDWYPWGPEAFERARKENKPIFLSIGYSSCFWCHVMERECFENAAIAERMNTLFICIKVDREERPDVDQVYMTALQAFTGGGGWPMSMFLMPDGKPFFGGTYFPPVDKENSPPAFPKVLEGVAQAWKEKPKEIEEAAAQLTDAVRRFADRTRLQAQAPLEADLLAAGTSGLAEQFDPEFGGFGYAPDQPRQNKFPEPTNLVFLLDREQRAHDPEALPMTLKTLDHMARGGIRDHLGGGYHRYTVDRAWQVPHFEKMLYDNAQLASVFVTAYEITKDERWKVEAQDIFTFVARDLTAPEGGFDSSLDAETDGDEGGTYVWTRDEVNTILGASATAFSTAYGLGREPNFENGRYVLVLPKPLDAASRSELAPAREKLLAARAKRPAPRRDDKVLTSWNGLMIGAYADGYRVLKDPRYRAAAEKAADFIWANLRTPDGRLLRTWRAGQAKLPGYLEDYAFLAAGLLRLHAATGDAKRLEQAKALADRMLADFQDDQRGGFYYTADDHESLLARFKDPYDNALPGGNGVAVRVLAALARATGDAKYHDAAEKTLNTLSPTMRQTPAGAPNLLVGLAEFLAAKPDDAVEPAAAQVPADDPFGIGTKKETLTARVALDPGNQKPRPGSTITLKVLLSVKDGWHVYANPTGAELLRPTVVEVDPKAAMKVVKVDYPKGKPMVQPDSNETALVYEGDTGLTVHLKLGDDLKPGVVTLPIRVRYQACNDRLCLAPAVLAVPVKLTVEP